MRACAPPPPTAAAAASANSLAVYRSLKRLGLGDDRILLMQAECHACDPRNPRPGAVHTDHAAAINVYGDEVEVDFGGRR